MEECKLSYTHSLLTRIARRKYVGHVDENASDRLASETRGNYQEHGKTNSRMLLRSHREEFVEMMVVDGLFIIELLTRRFMYIYTLKWDLLLLENQLPIFVLEHLFNLTATDRQLLEGKCLKVLVLALFKYSLRLPDGNTLLQTHPNCRHARHFLDLIAIVLHPTPHRRVLEELHSTSGKVEQTMRLKQPIVQSIIGLYSSCRLFTKIMISGLKHTATHIFTKGTATSTHPRANIQRDARSIMKFTPSATELNRAGVKFKRGCTENGFYDIKFNRGALEIPPILIQDQTELLFRNFLMHLITSAEDVELLRSKGIIRNSFGSDESVANLFNKLTSKIKYHKYYYSEVTNQVNEYYNRRRHFWKANLKREYLKSPWSIISFAAALLLIILTIMAALFAQLSFFVHKSYICSQVFSCSI
ncbi:hypothetical protein MKX01_002882 [Papaver californicum]|nr:hypothetical protein MKX01_002882 [Papaver californicum]